MGPGPMAAPAGSLPSLVSPLLARGRAVPHLLRVPRWHKPCSPRGQRPAGDRGCVCRQRPARAPAGREGKQGQAPRGRSRSRADPVTGSTGQRDGQRTAMQQKGLLVIINN